MLVLAVLTFVFGIYDLIARAAKVDKTRAHAFWGSARVSRAGFGVAPKQSFFHFPSRNELRKSSRSRGRARQHARRVRYPGIYTRERRRPVPRLRDEYLTGLRFGSIFEIPTPLFTSMIWSRKSAARSNSRFADACCISSSSSRSNSVRLKSPPASRITDDSISRPRKIVCRLSCTARRTV